MIINYNACVLIHIGKTWVGAQFQNLENESSYRQHRSIWLFRTQLWWFFIARKSAAGVERTLRLIVHQIINRGALLADGKFLESGGIAAMIEMLLRLFVLVHQNIFKSNCSFKKHTWAKIHPWGILQFSLKKKSDKQTTKPHQIRRLHFNFSQYWFSPKWKRSSI